MAHNPSGKKQRARGTRDFVGTLAVDVEIEVTPEYGNSVTAGANYLISETYRNWPAAQQAVQYAAINGTMTSIETPSGRLYFSPPRLRKQMANPSKSFVVGNPRGSATQFRVRPASLRMNQHDYTHYVYDPRTGKIYTGWFYPEDAKEELRNLVQEIPVLRGELKVLSKTGLMRIGIDPDNNDNWAELPELAILH
jgi:hypothetical protein